MIHVPNPLKFITTIRDSFGGSEIVYTQGSCYQFYLILKEVFPEAESYYDENHVITKIGNTFYDINGIVFDHEKFTPFSEAEIALLTVDPSTWRFDYKFPTYYHCFDLNEQEMTSFINYNSLKELAQDLYRLYGYRKDITFGMDAESICEILNFTIEETNNKI